MRTITFTVEGTPIAAPRHHGQGRRGYVPKEHRVYGWRQRVAVAALQAGCVADYAEPVKLTCRFVMPRLKKTPPEQIAHTDKPDLDNLIKAVKDALKGIAWADDCQVWRYGDGTRKVYVMDESPYAWIRIEYYELDEK